MRTGYQVKRITLNALFCTIALILSYIETLIPINFIIPIPGFKLGFANLAVMIAMYNIGTADALTISVMRIIISSILFGSVTSFWFSFVGGIFSFTMLLISKYIIKDRITYIGASIASAAAHNLGQIISAVLLLSDKAFFLFLPWLLLLSIGTGLISGILMISISKILKR